MHIDRSTQHTTKMSQKTIIGQQQRKAASMIGHLQVADRSEAAHAGVRED